MPLEKKPLSLITAYAVDKEGKQFRFGVMPGGLPECSLCGGRIRGNGWHSGEPYEGFHQKCVKVEV